MNDKCCKKWNVPGRQRHQLWRPSYLRSMLEIVRELLGIHSLFSTGWWSFITMGGPIMWMDAKCLGSFQWCRLFWTVAVFEALYMLRLQQVQGSESQMSWENLLEVQLYEMQVCTWEIDRETASTGPRSIGRGSWNDPSLLSGNLRSLSQGLLRRMMSLESQV